jgi:RNA recognition motif-containing protein
VNIYVGNLPSQAAEMDLRQIFEKFGEVTAVNIIKDKFTGEQKGFGFIEMPTKEHAEAAISGLNGQQLNGRSLTVNEARPRADNRTGNRGGSGGGYNRSW